MIHYVQTIIVKENVMQKVTSEIKDFQKEIKDVYSLFKPLIEKMITPFLG